MPATWIAFARRDVQAADVLQHNGIYEESRFHAQQAAEKASEGVPATQWTDTATYPRPV